MEPQEIDSVTYVARLRRAFRENWTDEEKAAFAAIPEWERDARMAFLTRNDEETDE